MKTAHLIYTKNVVRNFSKFLNDFNYKIIVKCPSCTEHSNLLKMEGRTGYRFWCQNCSYTKEWTLKKHGMLPIPSSGPTLKGFNLELWFQTNCCGEILWAYNTEHVSFLEKLISAKLRGNRKDPKLGWSNGSIQSRLPSWMLSSKNRQKLLKALNAL